MYQACTVPDRPSPQPLLEVFFVDHIPEFMSFPSPNKLESAVQEAVHVTGVA